MTAKIAMIIGSLALSSLAFAGAKSYDIILSSPTKAGSTELKPGDYKLKVEGSQAVFERDGKQWSAPVTIENQATKFNQTTVESSAQGDMNAIRAIDLGGSNVRLDFSSR